MNENGFTYYSSEAKAIASTKAPKAKKENTSTSVPIIESSVDTSLIEKAVLGFMDKNGG